MIKTPQEIFADPSFIEASNANTPTDTLEMFAKDKDWRARMGVALNRNTPLPLLNALAKDKNTLVRQIVARHPKISVSLQKFLVQYDKSLIYRDSDEEIPEQ